MTSEPERLLEGRSTLRNWSVVRSESGVVVRAWSNGRQKLLGLVVVAVAVVPGYLLWTLIGSHSTSTMHWMAAMLYTATVFVSTFVLVDLMGRETVRLEVQSLTVRHFSLFTWVTESLETGRGARLGSGGDAAGLRGVVAHAGGRRIDFGRLLPDDAADEIASALRAAIVEPVECDAPVDGVVRRVTRHQSQQTPAGADDLIALDAQVPLVSNGVLHWGAPPLPWAGVIALGWFVGMAFDAVDEPITRLLPVAIGTLTVGALVCRGGVLDNWSSRRRRGRGAVHVDEPWRAVPYWTDGVITSPVWKRCGVPVGAIALGAAAIVGSILGADALGASGVVFVALAGLWCSAWVYRLQNVFFQGLTEVRVRAMPVPARGPVVLDFAVARRGSDFESIHFTLSRIVEVPRAANQAFVGYSHRAEYELPEDRPPPAPGEQVEAHFTLPPDASGTDLSRGRPVYWMLEVSGQTSSGFYSERFPVPIYDV